MDKSPATYNPQLWGQRFLQGMMLTGQRDVESLDFGAFGTLTGVGPRALADGDTPHSLGWLMSPAALWRRLLRVS